MAKRYLLAALALPVLGGCASKPAPPKATKYHCPPLGKVLPAPLQPSSSDAVAEAIGILQQRFDNLTSAFEATAVSFSLKSIHEDDPLLDLHYTPPKADKRSTEKVDADTVYRIASISKVFSPLAALQIEGVDMNDPVTKYLPELRELKKQQEDVNDITTIPWDDITLLALANHMGGFSSEIAQDLGNFFSDETRQLLGLPELDDSEKPGCSGLLGIPSCTKEDFFEHFGKHSPAFAPFTTPMYANIPYSLLTWAVEAASNQTMEAYAKKNIFDVAGMERTTTGKKPEDSTGFIVANDVWWDGNLELLNPGGGYYSTTKDLLNFGEALLENRLLSAGETRKWLKPTEHSSSLGLSIGAPWEIYRLNGITSDGRVIDVYTKSGDLGPYHNMFVLLQDFDMVLTILTAGPESSPDVVFGSMAEVLSVLVPAIDQASKDEAKDRLAGTFSDEVSNSTITLSVDDGPGLAVTDWFSQGVDVIQNYPSYSLGGAPEEPPEVNVRLFPTGLTTDGEQGWRAVFYVGSADDAAAIDKAIPFIPQATCKTFFMFERVNYGLRSMDDFVLKVDGEGAAQAVTPRFFQTTMQKQ